MAGGMREWVGDIFGARTYDDLVAEVEPTPDTARGESSLRRARSGAWNAESKWARAASRGVGHFALTPRDGTGLPLRKDARAPRHIDFRQPLRTAVGRVRTPAHRRPPGRGPRKHRADRR